MKSYKLICIFHKEITASLTIWSNGNFKCYGCGITGDIKDNDYLNSIHEIKINIFREQQGQSRLFT